MAMSEWDLLLGAGCGLTAGLLVILDDRRLLVVILAVQYALTAVVIAQAVPVSMAVAKGAAGLLAAGVLALTVHMRPEASADSGGARLPKGRAFRVAASLLVLAIGLGLGHPSWSLLPGLGEAGRLGSAFLFTLGLLHLGISEEPLRVGVGLLTLLCGFDIPYSLLEPSLAVTAVLAAVTLGTAVVASYLVLAVWDVTREGPA